MRFNLSFIIGCLFICPMLLAQESLEIDNRYREDQFYASITYNLITDTPQGVSQNNFSTGFHFGFIRDMPFNKKRNWAVGLGLGVSSNSYNQNILITEDSQGVNFAIDDGNSSFGNLNKNKFTTYLLEVPFELRWRTSTATNFKFWRIYPGLKFSYLVYNSSKLQSDLLNLNLSNIDAFNTLQYGLTLSVGYGTWNFNIYYGLNPIFDSSTQVNGNTLEVKALKIGLIFYIL